MTEPSSEPSEDEWLGHFDSLSNAGGRLGAHDTRLTAPLDHSGRRPRRDRPHLRGLDRLVCA